jgi:hypothetical protein
MDVHSDRATALRPAAGPAVWTAAAMAARRDEWLHVLDARAIDEIAAAAEALDRPGVDVASVDRERFVLPALAPVLARLRRRILDGCGWVQIRGLPVEALGRRRAAIAFWGIARHLGDAVVPQNGRGDLLGHVRDRGQALADPTSRGPYTRARLDYHSDPCDVVGLLCLHPAESGGDSTLVSAGLVYNEMLRRRPELAAALTFPVYRDRRGEVPCGRGPWYAIPVFSHHAGRLLVNHEPVFAESVARHFDADPNTPPQREAMVLLEALADELHLDVAFEAGDMQFLHNYAILHSRRAFVDADVPQRRRHLLRIWLLNRDGWPVPEVMYERYGSPETTGRPGGFAGAEAVPRCALEDDRAVDRREIAFSGGPGRR